MENIPINLIESQLPKDHSSGGLAVGNVVTGELAAGNDLSGGLAVGSTTSDSLAFGNDTSVRQPFEDRALKAAALFMGKELLPMLGIERKIRRIAPTEQVHLEIKDFMEDFNYEMEDGTWLHLEFESDSITKEDLRRFRSYEAVTSYYYKTDVTTCVICTSQVRKLRKKLKLGINTYRIQVVRLKDQNADEVIRHSEKLQKAGTLKRQDLAGLLLTPLMDGQMPQTERIRRSLKLLQQEQELLGDEDLVRMQSVLYTLAMKFLTSAELNQIREVLNMTVLGQMLMEDGIEQGIKQGMKQGMRQGIEKGVQALIETCREFQLSKQDTEEKIAEKFSLPLEEAKAFILKYWK